MNSELLFPYSQTRPASTLASCRTCQLGQSMLGSFNKQEQEYKHKPSTIAVRRVDGLLKYVEKGYKISLHPTDTGSVARQSKGACFVHTLGIFGVIT